MALLDPDDRRDHDMHIRFSAREYLLVLAALKLSGKSSVSAGVREFALERAQQINTAGKAGEEGGEESLPPMSTERRVPPTDVNRRRHAMSSIEVSIPLGNEDHRAIAAEAQRRSCSEGDALKQLALERALQSPGKGATNRRAGRGGICRNRRFR